MRINTDDRGNGKLKQPDEEESNVKAGKRVRALVLFLVLGFAVYAALSAIQIDLIEKHKVKTVTVYTAARDIRKGCKITQLAAKDYFVEEERPIDSIPQNAVTNLAEVSEAYTVKEYTKKDVITQAGFHKTADILSELENPVEVSIGMDSPAQVVGGTVREGDRINIYSIHTVKYVSGLEERELSEEKICEAIYLNAFVTGAYTASGGEVRRMDEGKEEQPATIITILLPMEAEREFQLAADNGTVRVSRICGL